jgi:hypothetical protein
VFRHSRGTAGQCAGLVAGVVLANRAARCIYDADAITQSIADGPSHVHTGADDGAGPNRRTDDQSSAA